MTSHPLNRLGTRLIRMQIIPPRSFLYKCAVAQVFRRITATLYASIPSNPSAARITRMQAVLSLLVLLELHS